MKQLFIFMICCMGFGVAALHAQSKVPTSTSGNNIAGTAVKLESSTSSDLSGNTVTAPAPDTEGQGIRSTTAAVMGALPTQTGTVPVTNSETRKNTAPSLPEKKE